MRCSVRCGGAGEVAARGQREHERELARAVEQRRDELERGGVGPVQVLDDERAAAPGAASARERVGQRGERLAPAPGGAERAAPAAPSGGATPSSRRAGRRRAPPGRSRRGRQAAEASAVEPQWRRRPASSGYSALPR